MRVTVGGPPQVVNQRARHVLFVEGGPEGLDVTVLRALTELRVEGLGACNFVESVARAMREFHPEYWFIRDRDDLDDDVVAETWASFPDPARDNLLVWRRKELESYFLEPAWLAQSRYLRSAATIPAIERWIADEAGKSIWIEAAKSVFLWMRSQARAEASARWSPGDLGGLPRDQVARRLMTLPSIAALAGPRGCEIDEATVQRRFDQTADLLTGGQTPLAWGAGRWRDLVSAKALLNATVHRWFTVPNVAAPGRHLQGREATRLVALDLLSNHQEHMPADFVELRATLQRAISRSPAVHRATST